MSIRLLARLSARVVASETAFRGGATAGDMRTSISSTLRYGYPPLGVAGRLVFGAGTKVVGTETFGSGGPCEITSGGELGAEELASDMLVDFAGTNLALKDEEVCVRVQCDQRNLCMNEELMYTAQDFLEYLLKSVVQKGREEKRKDKNP